MLDKILSLIGAGYTKDEISQIMALTAPSRTLPDAAEPTKDGMGAALDAKGPERPEPPSDGAKGPIYALTSAQLTELIQSINLQNAGGGIDTPKTADDVVAERFNALFHIEHTDK